MKSTVRDGDCFSEKQNERRRTTRIIQRNEKILLEKNEKAIVFVERTNFPILKNYRVSQNERFFKNILKTCIDMHNYFAL